MGTLNLVLNRFNGECLKVGLRWKKIWADNGNSFLSRSADLYKLSFSGFRASIR